MATYLVHKCMLQFNIQSHNTPTAGLLTNMESSTSTYPAKSSYHLSWTWAPVFPLQRPATVRRERMFCCSEGKVVITPLCPLPPNTWVIATYTMLLPACTILTIYSLYTTDWCMPTCITKMYCSDMSDTPMAASSKASPAT